MNRVIDGFKLGIGMGLGSTLVSVLAYKFAMRKVTKVFNDTMDEIAGVEKKKSFGDKYKDWKYRNYTNIDFNKDD